MVTQEDEVESSLWTRFRIRIFSERGLDYLVEICLVVGMLAFFVYGLAGLIKPLEMKVLAWPVFAGALVGWLLAGTRMSGGQYFLVILLTSIFFSLAGAGGFAALFWRVLLQTSHLTSIMLSGQSSAFLEQFRILSFAVLETWFRLLVVWERGFTWFESLLRGTSTADKLVLALLWVLVIFWISAWAAWAIHRREQILAAALPAGILLSVTLAFSGGGIFSLIGFLCMVLLLLSWKQINSRQRSWENRQMDYAEDVRLDVSIASVAVTGLLLLAAGTTTLFSIERLESFLDNFRPVTEVSSTGLGETFGLEQRIAKKSVSERQARISPGIAGLPLAHLLGSGPELSQEIVMLVSTGDLPKLPSELTIPLSVRRYYWKALNFDVYTGSGWKTSPTEQVFYPPGEAVLPGFILFPTEGRSNYFHPAFRRTDIQLVQQEVREMADLGDLVLVTGELLGVNQKYLVEWRLSPDPSLVTEGDLFAALRRGPDRIYQSWSARSQPGKEALRSAGEAYPDWVRKRYLDLPGTIPERVWKIGQNLQQDYPNAYDRALAIEHYLRQFPYSLDIPSPPENRDVVDYFLFDLQTGYCDYYATAMVVLARSAGLPARMAVGYASGNYDPHQAVYTVTEENGHSWPEIYFPGLGWVEFEPTPALPAIERPGSSGMSARVDVLPARSQTQPLPRAAVPWRQGILVTMCLAGAAFLAYLFIERMRFRKLPPNQMIRLVFCWIYQKASRLGYSNQLNETPSEFAARFSSWLANQKAGHRWKEPGTSAAEEILRLSEMYNRSIYSQHPSGEADRAKAWQSWLRLRGPLRYLRWRRIRYR